VGNVIPEEASTLVDLTQISLIQLRSLDDSVLGTAIRRLLEEVENPSEVIARFQSCVLDEI
jgi:FXSXX-COOH protein